MSYHNLTKLAKASKDAQPENQVTNKEMMSAGAKLGLTGLGSGLGLKAVGNYLHNKTMNKLKEELDNIARPLTDNNGDVLDKAKLEELGELTSREKDYIKAKKVVNLANSTSALGAERAAASDLYHKHKKVVDDYEEAVRNSRGARARFDKARLGGTLGSKIKSFSFYPTMAGLVGGLAVAESGLKHLSGQKYYNDSLKNKRG